MNNQTLSLDQLEAEGWRAEPSPPLRDGSYQVHLTLGDRETPVHAVSGTGSSHAEALASAVLQANLWRQSAQDGE